MLGTYRNGGNGGLDINTLRRIIAEELKKTESEIVTEPAPEIIEKPDTITPQISKLAKDIAELKASVDDIPTDTVDLTEIKQAMEKIYSSINEKEVTPATDLQPVLAALDQATTDVINELEYTRTFLQDGEEKIMKAVENSVETNMKSAKFVHQFNISPQSEAKPVPQPKEPEYDMSKLSL